MMARGSLRSSDEGDISPVSNARSALDSWLNEKPAAMASLMNSGVDGVVGVEVGDEDSGSSSSETGSSSNAQNFDRIGMAA